MTSKNMNNLPFLLRPVGKDYLWGGSRLHEEYGKDTAPLAESWECSTHADGPSVVASGVFAGRLLGDILKEYPEMIGSHPRTRGELPILIKFIDAARDLSVQVHPDDAYALTHENGSWGKSEMWYVLDAQPDTKLIYGFHHDMDREELRKSLADATVEKYLQKIPVQKDDVFFVEAGTVHAIGAGALIAEIQQNSNLTYRLYDYNRVDKDGRKRKLHIEKALAVANLKSSRIPRQPMRLLRYQRGCATELLCRCEYFQVERMLLNTTDSNAAVPFQTGGNSFRVLLCIEGRGVIFDKEEEGTDVFLSFAKGNCIFVPANSAALQLKGNAQLLQVEC